MRAEAGLLENTVSKLVQASLAGARQHSASLRGQLLDCQAELCAAAGRDWDARAARTSQVRRARCDVQRQHLPC